MAAYQQTPEAIGKMFLTFSNDNERRGVAVDIVSHIPELLSCVHTPNTRTAFFKKYLTEAGKARYKKVPYDEGYNQKVEHLQRARMRDAHWFTDRLKDKIQISINYVTTLLTLPTDDKDKKKKKKKKLTTLSEDRYINAVLHVVGLSKFNWPNLQRCNQVSAFLGILLDSVSEKNEERRRIYKLDESVAIEARKRKRENYARIHGTVVGEERERKREEIQIEEKKMTDLSPKEQEEVKKVAENARPGDTLAVFNHNGLPKAVNVSDLPEKSQKTIEEMMVEQNYYPEVDEISEFGEYEGESREWQLWQRQLVSDFDN